MLCLLEEEARRLAFVVVAVVVVVLGLPLGKEEKEKDRRPPFIVFHLFLMTGLFELSGYHVLLITAFSASGVLQNEYLPCSISKKFQKIE